ncbi:DUF927 domain-containing protein [Rhodospirillaceae bacterium SYSU D60014]|uniref:DUF927 domain-containing protein n=1 Tax=Virgifigura deserti TaxID=2268457 RepID=UPI0013C506A3
MREDGLWWINPDPEKPDLHISGPFTIEAGTRSGDGRNWGLLMSWNDGDGRRHQWAMPRSLLAGDGVELRAYLLDRGLYVAPDRKAREQLPRYLAAVRTDALARAVDRTGWHGSFFVFPDATIGDTRGEQIVLQTPSLGDNPFQTAGTLQDWQDNVASCAVGNSRLVLALSVAFAAPLLAVIGAENGGFHLRGASSVGKTTALVAAGSVWGGGGVKGYVRQWRTTDNGLEAIAAALCDALLVLDELSQAEPKVAGAGAYMIVNGAGKARAGRGGSARPSFEWRLMFLSSGEIGIADKLAEDGRGRRIAAGQEVRVIDVPADAGRGLGLFEDLHGHASADAFARALKEAASRSYGTAARSFIEKVAGQIDSAAKAIVGHQRNFVAKHCPAGADGQVSRVAGRFGLIAAAGELATTMGVLPWPRGEAMKAAAVCFGAWLEARGGHGPAEIAAGIAQIREFIEAHGESRFAPAEGDDKDRRTVNRVGFRRVNGADEVEYFVLPASWKSELLRGRDARVLSKELVRRSLLIPDKLDGKPQSRHTFPGMPNGARYYHLAARILRDGGNHD